MTIASLARRTPWLLVLGIAVLIGGCSDNTSAGDGNTATPSSPAPAPALAPPPVQTTYTLMTGITGSGTITSSPAGIQCGATCSANFNSGASVTLTATPAAGYSFTGWSGACGGAASICTVTMSAARNVAATFTLTAPGGSTPTASLQASRLSGVAPLAVLFDATGSTEASTDSFRELTYSFDFGDVNSGTWAISGLPKNTQVGGPLAAHVFDAPGTYTVSVQVTNGSGASSNASVVITVTNPDTVFAGTNTVCVSTSGNYSGCPVGALT